MWGDFAQLGGSMNLYLISRTDVGGYDTYDSAVVCAPDEESARDMDPDPDRTYRKSPMLDWSRRTYNWVASRDMVIVTLLGVAADGIPAGSVLGSFNAG